MPDNASFPPQGKLAALHNFSLTCKYLTTKHVTLQRLLLRQIVRKVFVLTPRYRVKKELDYFINVVIREAVPFYSST